MKVPESNSLGAKRINYRKLVERNRLESRWLQTEWRPAFTDWPFAMLLDNLSDYQEHCRSLQAGCEIVAKSHIFAYYSPVRGKVQGS